MSPESRQLLKRCLTLREFYRIEKSIRVHNIKQITTVDYILSSDNIMSLSLENIASLLTK